MRANTYGKASLEAGHSGTFPLKERTDLAELVYRHTFTDFFQTCTKEKKIGSVLVLYNGTRFVTVERVHGDYVNFTRNE